VIVQRLCHAYEGMTPQVVEQMTLNQILLLCMDEESLVSVVRRTPGQLAAAGVIPPVGEESYAQQVRRENAARRLREELTTKRTRRRARRAAMSGACGGI